MGEVSETFYNKLCDRLSIHPDKRPAAIRVMREWQRAEGGDAAHNPFNTTFREPGDTNYNRIGVQNFPNEDEGVDATARTLLQGRPEYGYAAIVHALRDGDAKAAARAVDHSSWGTHGLEKVVAGDQAQPTRQPGRVGRQDVADLQALCAHHGHAPANSQRAGGGWDGIAGPGTLQAVEAVLREGHEAVATVQAFLAEHGHAPANSRRGDGWDGIDGPGTQDALHSFLGE